MCRYGAAYNTIGCIGRARLDRRRRRLCLPLATRSVEVMGRQPSFQCDAFAGRVTRAQGRGALRADGAAERLERRGGEFHEQGLAGPGDRGARLRALAGRVRFVGRVPRRVARADDRDRAGGFPSRRSGRRAQGAGPRDSPEALVCVSDAVAVQLRVDRLPGHLDRTAVRRDGRARRGVARRGEDDREKFPIRAKAACAFIRDIRRWRWTPSRFT